MQRVSAAIERGNALERQISEVSESGDLSALPPEKTIAEAADLSPFERNHLLALHRKAAGDLSTLQRAMERFADPASKPFDPLDADDRAEVDALYRKLGANPEALAAVFRRTGLVPEAASAALIETGAGGERNVDQNVIQDEFEFSSARKGGRREPGFGEAAGLGALIVKLFEKYFGKSANPDVTVAEPAKPDLPQSPTPERSAAPVPPITNVETESPLAAQNDTGAPLITIKSEDKQAIASRLRTSFEQAALRAPRTPDPIRLGVTTLEGAVRINAILEAAGYKIDTTGFRREVDAFAARHVHKRHGDQQTETALGQLPVTAEDWARIPDIVAFPDQISIGRRRSLPTIINEKKVNGYILYVEEVRTGARTLTSKSMWKKSTEEDKK